MYLPLFTILNLGVCTMSESARCKLIELIEEGRFTWELVAREFIVATSEADCEDILDTLIDNY